MNMLLITQVHYVTDIIGGLVIAVWFHRTATRIVYWLDKALSFPFFVVKWIYENKCKPYCQETEESTDGSNEEGGDGGKRKELGKGPSPYQIEHRYETIEIESRKSL